MILGIVNRDREAIIQIALMGIENRLKSLSAVVDTGFTGDLMLPMTVVVELGFEYRGVQEALLGNGSSYDFEVYAGSIIWDGQVRSIEVNACDSGTLIGMSLLDGWKLEIEGKVGGDVRITALE